MTPHASSTLTSPEITFREKKPKEEAHMKQPDGPEKVRTVEWVNRFPTTGQSIDKTVRILGTIFLN
jgi:hypothetical protein